MKKFGTKGVWILLILTLISGCSTKSNFYKLEPISTEDGHKRTDTSKVIGIGNVKVADYLNQKQLVVKVSNTKLDIEETHRWAGNLSQNIQEVLRDNLSTLLPKYTVLSFPWEEPVDDRYRVFVSIDSMQRDADNKAVLKGSWSLVNQESGKLIRHEEFSYSEVTDESYDSLVEAQSSMLTKLSRHIAKTIARL